MFNAIYSSIPDAFSRRLTAAYFKLAAFRKNGLRGSHSESSESVFHKMKVQILPALSDNYMYLIVDERSKEAAVVDPVDPASVLQAVKDQQLDLTSVLTTHYHWDHAGGNAKLFDMMGGSIRVYGGGDRIPALTHKVKGGDVLNVGNIRIDCLSTPCHTTDHICYYVTQDPPEQPAVFTGDTLFVAGCGRFFEGTADQMHSALLGKLAKLPAETRVFCGHEYTEANLRFAQHVEPANGLIGDKARWASDMRARRQPTVPSTIADELQTNPFMRVDQPQVQQHAGSADAIEAMRRIRLEKDNFK